MPSSSQLNSPLAIALPRDPSGLPKELQPYFEELYNALYQIQLAFVNFCGIATQPKDLWNQLLAVQTIFQQNQNRFYVQLSETVVGGAIVSLFNVAGVVQARNANATNNTKPAHGYCNTAGGGVAGDFVEVILFSGLCTLIGSLTPGSLYFLSTVDGVVTAVKPVAAGNIEQYLGVAIDSSTLYFSTHYWVQH